MTALKDKTLCVFCGDPCSTRRRPGEDGLRIRQEGACDEYRPFCSAPGYCWCGHWRERHASVPLAERSLTGRAR